MAGGRRPASYVSGARHSTGVDRQNNLAERPVSPTLSSMSSASLPLWIPSIWQPQPANSLNTKETGAASTTLPRNSNSNADSSSALAAALNSAVQSAVVRALGTSTSNPLPSQQNSSTITSDTAVDDESSSGGHITEREKENSDLIEDLRVRLGQRDGDVQKLSARLDSMETRLLAAESVKKSQDTYIADLSMQVRKLSEELAETERKQGACMASLCDQWRANKSVISDLRDQQSNLEADTGAISKETRGIADDVIQMRQTLSTELERTCNKVNRLDCELRTSVSRLEEQVVRDISRSELDAEAVKRNVDSTSESVVSMRSRLKRLEAAVGDVNKQANDSIALRSGFEDSVKEGLDQIRTSVSALRAETGRLRSNMSKSESGGKNNVLLSGRIDALEGSLKALKKLIESNLRTQWSAEGIVKEQVSLITKHVCVAMRQYTARRISENNTLIDKALRARIPQYAQNDDQFVLVREEDVEGNESVDIQRTSEIASKGA